MSAPQQTDGDGSFARGLARGVWIPLGMTGVAVASAAAVSPVWVGLPLLGVWVLMEASHLWLLRTLTAGIARGDGSAFLVNGERVDLDGLIRLNGRSRWQLPLVLVAMGACAASTLRIGLLGLIPTFLCLLPLLMLVGMHGIRTAVVRINRANALLQDTGGTDDEARLDRVETLLAGVRVAGNPGLQQSLVAQQAQLAAQRGEVGRYRSLLEQMWSGGMDIPGIRLAAFLEEHGDATLAHRFRQEGFPQEEVEGPSNALVAYWDRRLRVQQALLAGDLDGVVARTEELRELPDDFAEGLWLPRQVALKGLGRPVDSEGPSLETLVRRLSWARCIAPRSWAVYDAVMAGEALPEGPSDGAASERRVPAAIPVDEASRGSEEASAGPSRQERGYVPVEWMPAGVHMTRRRRIVQALAAVVLIPLGLLLLGLSALVLLGGQGGRILSFAVPVAVLALGVPTTVFVRQLLVHQSSFSMERARRPGFEERGIVRADGEGLLEERFLIAFFANSAPAFMSLLLFGAVGPLVEWMFNGTAYSAIPGAFVALLVGWSSVRLAAGARAVERAHLASPADWLSSTERIPGWLALSDGRAGWLGLARLWNGDRQGARDAWRSVLLHRSAAEGLQSWLPAGDGTLDLAHLVARPLPERPGPAYRFAVTLVLAALASDDSEAVSRVRDRSDALRALGRGLPNRFGDLLLALLDRLDDPRHPLPADLMWFDAVWPGLWAGERATGKEVSDG